MRVNVLPVELERMMRTLAAFTSRSSATEPVATTRIVEGALSAIDSAVVKSRGAAYALVANTMKVNAIAPLTTRLHNALRTLSAL
jgi:hypothetical protein